MRIESDYDVINYEAGVDSELRGQECHSCFRLLTWEFFDRNSAYKNGREPQCSWCKTQPRLSLSEHTSRLREMNYNSEGTRRQRHPDTDDLRGSRTGRPMDCSLFIQKLHHILPSLYITQGGIAGDIALYITSGSQRKDWNGQSFKYLGYCTLGVLPEYSEYEFDQRDILLRAKKMGWRSVLLRFIESKILTEEQINKEFGVPSCPEYWAKKLHQFRNKKSKA